MIKMKAATALITLSVMLGVSCLSCSRFSNKINSLLRNKFYSSVALVQSTPGRNGHGGGMATAFAIDKEYLLTAGHFCDKIDSLKKMEMVGDKILVVRSDKRGMPRTPIIATMIAFVFLA